MQKQNLLKDCLENYKTVLKLSDVSNRKNEKTTINYLKREGSKFPVRRGNEWI